MKTTLSLLSALLLALPVARASDTPKPTPAANCEFPADWFLFGMAERNTPEPDFTTITDIPATLDAGRISLSAKATLPVFGSPNTPRRCLVRQDGLPADLPRIGYRPKSGGRRGG